MSLVPYTPILFMNSIILVTVAENALKFTLRSQNMATSAEYLTKCIIFSGLLAQHKETVSWRKRYRVKGQHYMSCFRSFELPACQTTAGEQ